MKKKIVIALLAIVCALCCALNLTSCGKTFTKTNEFISVSDRVFTSAGYKKQSSNNSKSTSAYVSHALPLYATGQDGGDAVLSSIRSFYNTVKTDDNAGVLDEYNLNYIKGSSLYQGANLAGLFKSVASVLGDDVFTNVYDISNVGLPNSVAKLEHSEYYTLYGVTRENSKITSAVHIDFQEYESDKFVFKLAQYDKLNDRAELHFSYYDSVSVAFVVTLKADLSVDYTDYEDNYSAFSVSECSVALFDNEDYVSVGSNNGIRSEEVLKLAKENFGFGNSTYNALAGIGGGKSIGNKDAAQIGAYMSANRYVNPYVGTNGNMNINVSEQYAVPSDVTVVESATIPATKKLIVPSHVVKILDSPFQYPQFVEEIVFEDPDNGSLVQIGNDDEIFKNESGEILNVFNTSYNFLISYTKVKNFTLPKTVKKIAGPIYVTTEMETLDLSDYHPDYELVEDIFGDKQRYEVKICTSVVNGDYGLYKELGYVHNLYVNGDFALLKYNNSHTIENVYVGDNGEIKILINEYQIDNKTDGKHYEYSPTADLLTRVFGIFSGETAFTQFAEANNYCKTDHIVGNLIIDGINNGIDFDSDLFQCVTVRTEADNFADLYEAIKNVDGKQILVELTENGTPKTQLHLYGIDGEPLRGDQYTPIILKDGSYVSVEQLKYADLFYAPKGESEIMIDGNKKYFVGWSFSPNAALVDVYAGDAVTNYCQNMYAVYVDESVGITYVANDDGTYTAVIDGINADVIVVPSAYAGQNVTKLALKNYQCKKLIVPNSVNCASVNVLEALAENRLDSLQNIRGFIELDQGIYSYMANSALIEKLKICNAAVNDNGLYYLKSNISNYYMLFATDDSLSGTVYISNDCVILYANFAQSVSNVILPTDSNRLQHIVCLSFNNSATSLSIPNGVLQIEKISGKCRTLNIYGSGNKLNVFSGAFTDFNVSGAYISVDAFTQESIQRIADIFNKETALYLSCEYKSIPEMNFDYIGENMYFFSADEPYFADSDIAQYNYWHYDDKFNIVVWER